MMGRQEPQRSIFEASMLIEPKIEEGSIYHLLHDLGDQFLQDDDFSVMYSTNSGRPSLPPSLLAKVLLLQRHDNISDREAARRVKYDLCWLYALGLPLGYEGFAHANLSHFRSRLIVHNLERVPFDKLNELAVELGILDPGKPQAVDSSHIFGAGAVQDTYTLLRSSLRKLLYTLVDREPEVAEQLLAKLGLQQYKSKEKPDIDWSSAEERARWLKQLVADSRELLAALGTVQLADEVREAARLLSDILAQDIVEAADGDPRIKQGVAKDRIISTTDPEMRHGRKSKSQRFDGFKGHITEDLATELITNVEVTAGNTSDSAVPAAMVREQKEKFKEAPEQLLADSQYATADNRLRLKKLGTRMVGKLPTNPHRSSGRYTKDQFAIDHEKQQVTCPAGQRTRKYYQARDSRGRKVKRFQFPAKTCNSCPEKDRCTTSQRGRTITLHYHQQFIEEIRAYNETEEFRETYRRRALVERKLAELFWTHGMRYSRYIGVLGARFQLLFTSAMVNLKRLGKLLKKAVHTAPLQHELAAG